MRITHVIWADSIFLLSKTREEAQEMINDVTDRMKEMGLEWKIRNSDGSSALDCMAGGELVEEEIRLTTRTGEGEEVGFEQKKEIKALEITMGQEGNSYKCLRFRMRQAERAFWKHAKIFKGRGVVPDLTQLGTPYFEESAQTNL